MADLKNITELPPLFQFRPHPATDFIDMVTVINGIDESLRSQVIAAAFQTASAVYGALAEGSKQVAGIINSGGQRG